MTTPFAQRTPEYYIDRLDPDVLASFNAQQLAVMHSLLDAAISKPSPKIIDLRLTVDLIFSRFFIVLFVGKDRRQTSRPQFVTRTTRIANLIAATILLVGLNLTVSAFIFFTAYLLKSALGINLFPSSIGQVLEGRNSSDLPYQ